MKATAIVSSIAMTAHLFASQAIAQCARTPEGSDAVVRGRFVRCEDASFYLEASGAYQRYEQDLEAAIAQVGPENRDTLLERLGVTAEFPYDDTLEGRVVVVELEWRALIVPWIRETSEIIEFKEEPREMRETVRYWWRGSIAACEAIAEWSSVDLWVYRACCDTAAFGAPVCAIRMSYAEPAPDVMSDAFSQIIGEP